MITLITGVPGSGKSQYAVKLILDLLDAKSKAIKELPKLEKEGNPDKIAACKANIREIYTDIAGFDHERFGTHETPADWRDTPEGSAVFMDECQERYGPDGSGRAKNPQIQALEKHRHTGHDLYFITQRERLLHAHIRDLVGRHFHIQRQYGSHNVLIFRRDELIDTKSRTALDRCDQIPWRYEKRLFECYKSATVHTHKAMLPAWLKKAVFGMVVGLALVLFLGYKSIGFFTGDQASEIIDPESEVIASVDGYSEPITVSKRPPARLIGCVVWAQRSECRCHDVYGRVADLEFAQCMIHAEGSTLNFADQIKRDQKRSSDSRGGTERERKTVSIL